MRIVGTAVSVAEAREAARVPVDVVLMDYRLPDGTGVEATRLIKARWPSCRVLMLTGIDDDETVLESIQAGADGYLTKDRAVEDVVDAVRAAHAGATLLPRSVIVAIARRVAEARDRRAERTPVEPLTPRELEVLRALTEGLSTPRDLRPAGHHPQHAPDPRPEHHGQAPRALEARGRGLRAAPQAGRAAPREVAGPPAGPGIRRPPRAHAAAQPVARHAAAPRSPAAARGRGAGSGAGRPAGDRARGARDPCTAPQRGQRRSSANNDAIDAAV